MELIASEWGITKTFPLPFVTYGATDYLPGVTLAEGDVKVSKDGGAFENIDTLPTVLGAWAIVTLSAAEMQARSIIVQFIDQTATKVFEDNGAILTTDVRSWHQALFTLMESSRGSHTGVHDQFFWDPIDGLDTNSGLFYHDAKKTYDFEGVNGIHSLLSNNMHQIVHLLPNASGGPTTVNEYVEVDTAYTFLRGPGRDFLIEATHGEEYALLSSAEGVEFSGMRVKSQAAGNNKAIGTTGDFCWMHNLWCDYSRGSGIVIDNASSCIIEDFLIQDSAKGGTGHALHILGDTSPTIRNIIGSGKIFSNGNGGETDGIRIEGANCEHNFIKGGPNGLYIHANTGYGIHEISGADHTIAVGPTLHISHNTLGDYDLVGDGSSVTNYKQWAEEGADGDDLKSISDQIDILTAQTGAWSIIIQLYETGGTTPIADVDVAIWNSDETLHITTKQTDVNGQIAVTLDSATYKIRSQKAAWTFGIETMVITADATEIIYGDTTVIPLPGNPDACNVVCDLLTLGLAAKEGVDFTISLLKSVPQAINSAIIEVAELTQATDVTGRTVFTVAQGFKYEIVSPAFGEDERMIIDTTGKSSIVLGDET